MKKLSCIRNLYKTADSFGFGRLFFLKIRDFLRKKRRKTKDFASFCCTVIAETGESAPERKKGVVVHGILHGTGTEN